MYVKLCGLHEVLQCSDFVSLHLPLTPNTNQLISHSAISKMKKGSYLINTAKGEIIDEHALYEALASGHLAGAAVDVCAVEPIHAESPLLTLDNFIITPHIGVYTKEAIASVSRICAKNIAAKLCGGSIEFSVTDTKL